MRVLGSSATFAMFRWDLVYLGGELLADERAEVQALAPPVQAALVELRARREGFEQTEDEEVLATARLHRRDRRRDALLVIIGGTARATDKELNGTLFGKRPPTDIAKLGYDAETREIDRITGELSKLDAQHPIRAAYLTLLTADQAEFVKAKADSDTAALAMALARSEMDRFKLRLDQLRLATHGQLVTLLKDKVEADTFYRPASVTPGEQLVAPVDAPKVKPGVPLRPLSIEPPPAAPPAAKPAP